MPRLSLVHQVHALLAEIVHPGDHAVDATVGNGHDTLLLAQLVGENGHVYGFDIQEAALDETFRRLSVVGVAERVSLYHAGHEAMAMVLPESLRGKVRAVMFNLGYLPGGDKLRTTTLSTTLAALEQAREMLMPSGVISILAYTGHPGGRDEAEAVKVWAGGLASDYYEVKTVIPESKENTAPEWTLVTRSGRA